MPDLLPCPFCNSPATEPNVFGKVSCGNDWEKCNMALWGMHFTAWNTRADTAILKAKDAEIAKLRKDYMEVDILYHQQVAEIAELKAMLEARGFDKL